jgi:hypothetical protein
MAPPQLIPPYRLAWELSEAHILMRELIDAATPRRIP